MRASARTIHVVVVFERSFLDGGDTHLLEESEIVLDMPVVGDATIPDLQQISGNQRDRPAVAPNRPERAREMLGEAHVHRDVRAGHDHLVNRDLQVRHCAMKCVRREERYFRPLRPAGRQSMIGEVIGDSAL
jgi:hypothetical protein